MAIQSFACKRTKNLFQRRPVLGWGSIEAAAMRKLAMLHAAVSLEDLRAPPANRLESLSGRRLGQYSIRVNRQYRVCFTWTPVGPAQVEIIDYHQETPMRSVPYPTPGDILLHEFLEPLGLSQYRLAKAIDVPQDRISKIVNGERAITADTALRLSRFFGTSDKFWLALQVDHDAAVAQVALADTLQKIQPHGAAA